MTGTRVAATGKEVSLWLLDKFVPESGVNNLSLAFAVDGELDPARLQDTVSALLRRFQVLRTVFHDEESGLTKEFLPAEQVKVAVEQVASDVDDLPEQLTGFVARPFHADGSPLLRVGHFPRPDGDVCCVALHHGISDVQSTTILLQEFVACYDAGGEPVHADEVPAWTEPAGSEKSERFWRENMRGFDSSALELRCEQREPGDTTLDGDEVTHELSPAAQAAVKQLQREVRAPESVVLLAAYGLLLAAHGAGPDLTVGSPVNTRDKSAAGAIGYHSSILTLRLLVDRALSFRDLAGHARRTFFDAMAHVDFAADQLLEVVERADSSWRNVLFRHAFNYVPFDQGQKEFKLDGAPARLLVVENGSSQFDLEFFVTSSQGSLGVRGVFYTGVLDRADVESMLHRYDALLVAVAADADRPLGELPVWSERDREVIAAANDTERPLAYESVLSAFAGKSRSGPDAVAVVDGKHQVTYAQLWSAAVATRDRLAETGVRGGDVVALYAQRGPELAASVFGVWLAGAAYMPLDPNHPEQRIRYQLEDSGARTVLVGPGLKAPEGHEGTPMVDVATAASQPVEAPEVDPLSTAYLIYTSGSTGRPKGIPIRHRSLANVIDGYVTEFGFTAETPAAWLSTFSFDTSAIELMMPLVTGGHLVVAPDEARSDGAVLLDLLQRHEIRFLQATPTTWRLVADVVAEKLDGCTLLTGGEPIPAELAAKLVATGARVFNVYGPTESTIWATAGRVEAGVSGRVDVGGPIANTTVFIEGPHGEELPPGLRGELCVAGVGVGEGYHDRPELTADRFGEHPVHGRFYRSGDVARWTHDGRLDLQGRQDRQIKLRGNRIELGEVEAVLNAHPAVEAAAVVVVGDPGNDGVLAAFVKGLSAGIEDLWAHARELLPRAVVPHRFIPIEQFPRTGSDKVDYLALAKLAAEQPTTGQGEDTSGSAGELVDQLIVMWRDLLGRTDLGAQSHFFAEGGHSLLGVQLAQRVKGELGVRLKLTDVFEHPTPTALAARITESR
ncbi:non-ribosomal peptide synthetase [Amycolatopsis magusensis]|uniref:Amino acid adenylation domain-containing protein n=1 Tax=Amycolatopsis magusensis TaxID=882444 RepID=A0ABS4PM06_9PSEU|nr:non-ribosomal peptide synthetase [Amycolatopsis magusensis]MBP2180430.1 amino acid adenylation domain-containing protein [Amycolatopsis magusensis]